MRAFALVASLSFACTANAAVPARPPVAPERPVTDTYFGTSVVDPYRWMENRTAPDFIRYMIAQGKYARHVMDGIPGREKLQERVAALSSGGTVLRLVQN